MLLVVLLLTPLSAHASSTLSPLSNASVYVNGNNGSGYVSTGLDGIFKPLELAEGNYSVQIRHDGYVSRMLNTTITAGGTTDLGDIELKASGKIQGVVKDSDGSPVSDLQVLCQDESNNNTVTSTWTNNGNFSFDTDIQNGTYTIQAIVPPNSIDPRYVGNASNMTSGIEASEGQTTSGVVVQLRPSGTIMGTVKTGTNVSVGGAIVSAYPENNPGPLFFGSYTHTNSQGEYVIYSNLPTGQYRVSISEALGCVYSSLDFVNVTVTAGQNTTVDFVLEYSGRITGTITLAGGAPAPNIDVQATSVDNKYYGSAITGSNGFYGIVTGLGTGQYTVVAANDYANAKIVNVTAGETTPNVDFEVTRNWAWINGTVLTSPGGPIIRDVLVEAVAEGVFPVRTYADFEGKYSIEIQLPNGHNSTQVIVTASAMGYVAFSQNVTVNLGQTTSPVDFMLETIPVGTLTGRVVIALPNVPPRTVGVSVGNSFNYTVAFSWNSTEQNAILPYYYASLNDTEWIRTSVINVSGTTVILNMTMHFKNGTDSTQAGITDVTTGSGNLTSWIVGANLNPNDTLYAPSQYYSPVINETIAIVYPSGSRNSNHLNVTTETNTTGIYEYSSMNYYWDQSTGVMVEMSMAMVTQINQSRTNVSATVKIAESNIWIVPEFPTLTPMLVALVLLTATAVFGKKRSTRTVIH